MSSCTAPLKNGGKKKMHVAVLAFPFSSHALSLGHLMLKLATAAQETRFSFLTTEKSISMFLAARTSLPDNIKAYNVADGVPLNHVFSGDPIERLELFIKEAPENFKTALDMAVAETGWKISCLIADALMSFAGSIAENLSVPWIPVWNPLPYSFYAHIYTDMIRQQYANSLTHDGSNSVELEDQTLDVPGLSKFRIGDLPAEVLPPRDAKETLFSCMLGQIGHSMPKVDTLVLKFYQELYPEPLLNDLKSKFSNVLNIGFISLTLPPPSLPPSTEDVTGCLSWLDGQKAKSVAYISFGTVVNIPQSEIEELAEALEVSGTPFLWALRDSMSDCLPSGFLDRASTHGKVVPWAPQIQGGGIRSRAQDLKELVWKASAPGGRASQDFKTLVEKITSV
ncbi:hypothetical protein OIU84_009413 [Salix udensis]|uniref:Uncharacterized protein n=1 Tax=Salix udensis TaxID=889485 RepID=A0AAD6NYT8_9ROSI|nr:hypothetical protein OIU84_009413 [Salix udensis]